MKLLSVWASGFRSWDELALDVPEGIAAVVGENGAGKSSLASVADLALFGSGRELKRALRRRGGDEVEVGVEFEHAGSRYTVKRTWSERQGGRVAFWRDGAVGDDLLTRETIAATDAAIEELLGIGRQTWRASAYLAQGDGDAFTSAAPGERKAILLEALGVRLWDRLRRRAALEQASYDLEANRLLGEAEALEGELAARDGILAIEGEAALKAEAAAMAEADLEAGIAALRAEAEEARRAHLVYAGAQQEREAALSGLRHELAEEDNAAGRMADLSVAAGRERVQATVHADSAGERVAEAEADIARLAAEGAKCPTCGQPLDEEATRLALAALVSRRTKAEQERDGGLVKAKDAAVRAAAADEERAQLVARAADLRGRLSKASEERPPPEPPTGSPSVLATRLREAEHRLAARREERRDWERRQAEASGQLARLASLEQSARDAREALGIARQEAALRKLATRAYGRDGIPALILENAALPQLEAEANRLVGELGRPYRFELRTQKVSQEGQAREALDIIVHADDGEAEYEAFSGGERTRLDLALRIALARLLAARRGSDIRCLIIDEPAYLDADGFARLAGALRGLAAEFDSILVVSHYAELAEAFDLTLAVSGGGATGAPSRLDSGGTA